MHILALFVLIGFAVILFPIVKEVFAAVAILVAVLFVVVIGGWVLWELPGEWILAGAVLLAFPLIIAGLVALWDGFCTRSDLSRD